MINDIVNELKANLASRDRIVACGVQSPGQTQHDLRVDDDMIKWGDEKVEMG